MILFSQIVIIAISLILSMYASWLVKNVFRSIMKGQWKLIIFTWKIIYHVTGIWNMHSVSWAALPTSYLFRLYITAEVVRGKPNDRFRGKPTLLEDSLLRWGETIGSKYGFRVKHRAPYWSVFEWLTFCNGLSVISANVT